MSPPILTPRAIRETTREAFLHTSRWLAPVVAAPILAAIVWGEVHRGHRSWLMVVQAVAFVGLYVASWLTRRRPAVSGALLFALLVIASATSAMLYGPMAGNGALIVAACLLASFLFGGPLGISLSAAAFAVWALSGAAVLAGLVAAPPANVTDPTLVSTWLRTGLSLAIAVLAVGAMFVVVQRALAHAVAQASEERARALDAHRQREEAFRALAVAQRIESIGYLAGGVAHDLRNSLTVVLSSVEELRHSTDRAVATGVAEGLELAASAGVQSARRLLALAREHTGGRCRPGEVLAGLGRMLERVLPEEITLVVEAQPTAPVALAEGALSQAVLNLAVNARDAMPSGGRLVLRAREDLASRRVIVEVEDSGHGMDAATAARAFEPLFTTKAAGLGTGLGLPMVRRTAEEAGGKVELDSRPGSGTRVRLVLPALPAAAAPSFAS